MSHHSESKEQMEAERDARRRELEEIIPPISRCEEPGHYPTECKRVDKLEREKRQLLAALKNLLRAQKRERLNRGQIQEWYDACEQALALIREVGK